VVVPESPLILNIAVGIFFDPGSLFSSLLILIFIKGKRKILHKSTKKDFIEAKKITAKGAELEEIARWAILAKEPGSGLVKSKSRKALAALRLNAF
jgi:hypothetical protein